VTSYGVTTPTPPVTSLRRFVVERWPGLLSFALGTTVTFLLMANDRPLPFGVPLGALASLLATVGLLSMLGSFDGTPEMTVRQVSSALGREVTGFAVTFSLFIVVTRSIVAGTLPGGALTAGLLIPSLLGGSIVWAYRAVSAMGVFGPDPVPFYKHPSLLVLLVTIALYTPLLGSFSLIDPWETHYGEVAREILARDDWMSLWWAQDGWFWSKPVLDFWLQALSMALFGVRHAPDGMLAGFAMGRTPYPEWAVRLPILFLSLVAQILLYAPVAKCWGRRPALFGSLVLIAVPYYALIVHQSMTDLPYIATLMGAMGLFFLGFTSREQECVSGYELSLGNKSVVVSAHSLVFGAILLFALPQILYLFSRNLGLVTTGHDLGFYAHIDQFFAGSGGGNCGLPGNAPCRLQSAAIPSPQPSLSAFVYASLLVVLLVVGRGERRKKRLYYLAAWLCLALSALAKGLPGPIVFVATGLATLVLTRRLSETLNIELPSALLIFAVVALPWFVQSTMRHGPGFLERLFIHDMYKRAFLHVHDTNAGDDVSLRYYLWQLGYGLFPATGLITTGALGALFGLRGSKRQALDLTTFLGLWILVGFGLFSLTLTKFHHYIIPIVPALCLLTGPLLDAALDRRPTAPTRVRYDFLLIGLVAALVVFFAGFDLFGPNRPPGGAARLINLVTYNYSRLWPDSLDCSGPLLGFTVISVLSLLGLAAPRALRFYAALTFLISALIFSGYICNRYLPLVAPHWGQRETIATYYRARRSPDERLAAYQMNWKGENFYTGNRLATFIATGEKFRSWVNGQRQSGKSVLFFTLEHGRISGLKQELGPVERFEILTDKRLNNKFALVRVTLGTLPATY
jgi:4-amino-4-deoxy-L-arabinose transferase-like glycosyltransferase